MMARHRRVLSILSSFQRDELTLEVVAKREQRLELVAQAMVGFGWKWRGVRHEADLQDANNHPPHRAPPWSSARRAYQKRRGLTLRQVAAVYALTRPHMSIRVRKEGAKNYSEKIEATPSLVLDSSKGAGRGIKYSAPDLAPHTLPSLGSSLGFR